jgi:hypothetical protein
MSDKPVAWTDGNGHYFDKNSFFPVDDLIPLYTHPPKELTDDEIADLIKATNDETGFRHMRIFDFVKILLRKEREK